MSYLYIIIPHPITLHQKRNHSEDESQQPPPQQQQQHTSTTTFHPLTTDRGEWLSSTPTKPITSVYATTTTQYTNPRAAYHLRLYQRSIAAIGNFFSKLDHWLDILGETIALYNSLANSSNIHKPQPQLPQESSDHLTQKETSTVSASPHPMLDQAPQMIDARLERIEHEVDNFNERENNYQHPQMQPYSQDTESGLSLGTEDSQNISSQKWTMFKQKFLFGI